MGTLWVAKGPRFLQDENFDEHSMGSQGFFRRNTLMDALWVAKGSSFFRRNTLMGTLWVAKGPRFLQDENFDEHSMGSQGSKVSSGGIL